MGIVFELEESDFAGFIDDGEIYLAQVVNIRLVDKPYTDDDGNKVKRVEFKFRLIADDAHDGADMWGDTSTKFVKNPGCRLFTWAEALLGQQLPARYRLDTDILLDRQCRVVVGKKEWEKDGQARQRNYVRDVMPTREAMKTMAVDNVF